MKISRLGRFNVALGIIAAVALASATMSGQEPETEGANAVLPWAYVLNDPVPEGAPSPDPEEVVTVPGSRLSMRRADISINNGPPDWHPESHPTMPDVVATGGGNGVVACGYCHLPNGQGKPENAGLAGQPFEYIVRQMDDYRAGTRRSGEPRMGPPSFMQRIGAAASDEESRVAADYFSAIPFKPWVRVVETDMVPRTKMAGWIHEVIEGGGMEPIGVRIVETPEDIARTKLRDDAVGFVAYVPPGAVARGRALVTTGGASGVACTVCHGDDLRGLGPMPALAGRSPTYMARQLYDLQQGTRDGAWADLMDDAVADLTLDQIVDIVAYTASLTP